MGMGGHNLEKKIVFTSIRKKRLLVSPCVCNIFHPPKLFIPRGTHNFRTQQRGGKNFHTQGGDKHFYINAGGKHFYTRGGDKHFMLEAVVAMMMLMRRWIWVKRTFWWAKWASSPQDIEILGAWNSIFTCFWAYISSLSNTHFVQKKTEKYWLGGTPSSIGKRPIYFRFF